MWGCVWDACTTQIYAIRFDTSGTSVYTKAERFDTHIYRRLSKFAIRFDMRSSGIRVGNMFVSYPCILPSLHVAELGIHKSTDEKARLEG